jgi:sigma-B regulation protein RsbU (phosphoserine phosphatase)
MAADASIFAHLLLDDQEFNRWVRRGADEHAIMAVTDPQGVIVFANDRFCEISGYSREELVGQNHRMIKSGQHPPSFFAELWRTIGSGKIWRGMICNRTKGGELYWVESTILPLLGSDGRPRAYMALRTDVTRLKRAEESSERLAREIAAQAAELRQAQGQLQAFFDHATVGVSWREIGPDGKPGVNHVNDRFCELMGLTREESRDIDNVRRATHPDDWAVQERLTAEAYAGLRDNFSLEKRYLHRDGRTVWGHLTVVVLRNPDGRATHHFAMLQDITARHAAEEDLRAALDRREELEKIVNRSPSVVVLWRAEEGWPVEFVSQSISQFGYTPEEFLSRKRNFIGITHPEDRERVLAEVSAHASARHAEYNQEYRVVCADGSTRWVDDHTVVRRDAEGRVTHHEGLLTDVTARRDAEERARAVRERDLLLAGEIQQHLRPRVFPDITEVEIEALAASSMLIGGDYYDVVPVDARRWGFVVADVSGKGAGAALMMAACRATLRLCAAGAVSPASVLRRVNRALQPDLRPGMYITLFYGILDLDTDVLRYCRAGHEPALLLRRGASTHELLSAGGLALGLDEGSIFDSMLEEGEVRLGPGDLLALYTDGITEACTPAGEEFGRDRLINALQRHEDRPLPDVARTVDRYVRNFDPLGLRTDDRTLMLVRPR